MIVADQTRYNVHCMDCDQVWQPKIGSSLWWQAKQNAEAGRIDALHIGGKKCGCIPQRRKPDTPYRVSGYDDTMIDFDFPCKTFVQAAKIYRQCNRQGDVVFISGVSKAVEEQLMFC